MSKSKYTGHQKLMKKEEKEGKKGQIS